MREKNSDYTGGNDDPFANIRLCGKMGITDPIRGVLVRMCDKFARVVSFVNKGSLLVKDESVEDTCKDLAVYALMLRLLFESERKDAQAKTQPPAAREL